jgi:hypothetical protein
MDLLKFFDINLDGLCGLYQRERSNEFYAVFDNEEDAEKVAVLGSNVYHRRTYRFTSISQERINVRVHWLPLYVRNDYLKSLFSNVGKVIDVAFEKVALDGMPVASGIRTVTLDVSEKDKVNIPHRISTEDGFSMLVTCKGRLPLCLKCDNIGHNRAQCPESRAPRASYANAVRKTYVNVEMSSEERDDGGNSEARRSVIPVLVGSAEAAAGEVAGGAVVAESADSEEVASEVGATTNEVASGPGVISVVDSASESVKQHGVGSVDAAAGGDWTLRSALNLRRTWIQRNFVRRKWKWRIRSLI